MCEKAEFGIEGKREETRPRRLHVEHRTARIVERRRQETPRGVIRVETVGAERYRASGDKGEPVACAAPGDEPAPHEKHNKQGEKPHVQPREISREKSRHRGLRRSRARLVEQPARSHCHDDGGRDLWIKLKRKRPDGRSN